MSLLCQIYEMCLISAKQQSILSFVQFAAAHINLLYTCVTQYTRVAFNIVSLYGTSKPNRLYDFYPTHALAVSMR
jgi:hypothetical protein